MDWLAELARKEEQLRRDFQDLHEVRERRDLVSVDTQEFIRRRIRSRVEEIEHVIAGELESHAPEERPAIDYQLDFHLPIYHHLRRLLSLLS